MALPVGNYVLGQKNDVAQYDASRTVRDERCFLVKELLVKYIRGIAERTSLGSFKAFSSFV